MITCLEEVDLAVRNEVNNAVFECQPARPGSCQPVFQRFGFSDSKERFAQHRFNKIQCPDRNPPILLDPEAQILNKLRMENRETLNPAAAFGPTLFCQARLPCAEW